MASPLAPRSPGQNEVGAAAVKQLQRFEKFPSGNGRPFTVIRFTPEEITSRFGLTFEVDVDDLDQYRMAAIELADGSPALFLKHFGEDSPGTTVWVDEKADPPVVLNLLLMALDLSESDLLWVSVPEDRTVAEQLAVAFGASTAVLIKGFPMELLEGRTVELDEKARIIRLNSLATDPMWTLRIVNVGEGLDAFDAKVSGALPKDDVARLAWVDDRLNGVMSRALMHVSAADSDETASTDLGRQLVAIRKQFQESSSN